MTTKHVLLTGGLGFIGGHSVEHWLKTTDWDITVVDSLRHTGRVERLTSIEVYDPDRVNVVWHDLRSELHPQLMYEIGDVDYIVNMASDSHVDRSISDPVPFIHNNVMSTVNMLEYAHKVKPEKFVQISTDEVFGPAPEGYSHKEGDPLKPSNPYSASKAAQEQIAFSYWRTFDVPVIVTNTMNNVGEKQDLEKYVPMVVRSVVNGDRVTIHGHKVGGKWEAGSRVWLHARNHADALRFILETVDVPPYGVGVDDIPRFNIAGEREIDNLEMAQLLADLVGKPLLYEMVDFHASRPGHDLRYSLDGSKLRAAGWVPPVPLEESLEAMVAWYLANPEWLSFK